MNLSVRVGLRTAYCRIGESQLALGRTDAALASFGKYQKAAADIAASQPENPPAQRELGVSFYKMAELRLSLAGDPNREPSEQLEHLWEARSWLGRSLNVFTALRDRGKLSRMDAGAPDEVSEEIGLCNAAIERLESASGPAD